MVKKEFAPVETSRIPRTPGAFVGRSDALAELERLIASPAALITICGAPGVGKSRLVHEFFARAEMREQIPERAPVIFIELSDASSVDDFIAAMTQKLAAADSKTPKTHDLGCLQKLTQYLAEQDPLMVVLDTLEHLLETVSPIIGNWLEAAAQHRFIITSREPLHLGAERLLRLAPLLPDDAVSLFATKYGAQLSDVASLSNPGAAAASDEPDPGSNTPDIWAEIDQIVSALDGLPLAIELAAERAQTLPFGELIHQLGAPFGLLKTRRRDAPARHASMQAALDWSWQLLDETERDILWQTTVFARSFTLAAATALIEGGADSNHGRPGARPHRGSESTPANLLDILDGLVDKSLLRIDEGAGPRGARYAHLELIRRFAARQRDGLDAIKQRHAELCLQAGEVLYPGSPGSSGDAKDLRDSRDSVELLSTEKSAQHAREIAEFTPGGNTNPAAFGRWLQEEAQNLEAIFRRAARWQMPTMRLRAARLLDEHYERSGDICARRALLDQALNEAEAADDPRWQARFLRRRAELASRCGQFERAQSDYERALLLAHEDCDRQFIAWTRFEYGELCRQRGELERSLSEFQIALELAKILQNQSLIRLITAHLASCRVDRVEYSKARDLVNRVHGIESGDDLHAEAQVCRRLAYAHYYLGEFVEQRQLNQRALELARESHDRSLFAVCAQSLADSYFADSDFSSAIQLYREALAIHQELGDEHLEGILLGNLAAALHRLQDLDGAEDAYRRSLRIHRSTRAKPYLAVATSALGVLEHERSRFAQARAHYDVACRYFEELGQHPDQGSVMLYRGWLAMEIGEVGAAISDFEQAYALFCGHEQVAGWEAVALASQALGRAVQADPDGCAEFLERAAKKLRARPDSLEEHLVRGLARLGEVVLSPQLKPEASDLPQQDAREFAQRSLHARLLKRLMERLPGSNFGSLQLGENSAAAFVQSGQPPRLARPKSGARLILLVDGSGFEVAGRERVDLRRRRSLRLIMAELTRRARNKTPESLSVWDAFDIGWPGESIAPDIAAGRVYWAARTLRALGLEEFLITTDDGYILATHEPIGFRESFSAVEPFDMDTNPGENR